nr:unnamed protein product [Callosobruchus chinensis]
MASRPLLLFILLRFIAGFHSDKDDVSDLVLFLRGFFGEQSAPVKVAAYVCWERDVSLNFMKYISTDFSAAIYRIDQPIYIPEQWDELWLVYLFDVRCPIFNEILKQAEAANLFRNPFRWILWGIDTNFTVLENYYLRPDSRIYTVQLLPEYFMVKAVHKLSQFGEMVQVNVGKWIRSSEKFVTFEAISIYRDRSDLMGLKLNMTYVATANETLNHLEDYRFIHIDPLTKVNWITVGHLLNMLNITPLIKWEKTWGYLNPTTNVFSGMLGDLQTGVSELAGTQCFYTDDRIDYVDFVPASTPTYFKFIFRAPPLSYVTNIFTLPFDAYVWYCTVALIAVIFFVIYAITVWEWRDPIFKEKLEKMESVSTSALRPKALDVAVLEIGAITQQGTDTEPKSIAGRIFVNEKVSRRTISSFGLKLHGCFFLHVMIQILISGRIATLITLLALMFLYTSYSANIVALLQSTTESIKTLEDILNSRITLGVHDVVYGHYYFEVKSFTPIDLQKIASLSSLYFSLITKMLKLLISLCQFSTICAGKNVVEQGSI